MPIFVLNDETILTAHGFVVSNAGGNFERFKENPVMLSSHDDRAVIGRWNNILIEGSKLKAEAEFDKDDPDATKIEGKVNRGFIKGASMGIIPLEAEYKDIPNIGGVVVLTKWELLEASVCAIPSNKGALRLYATDGKTELKNDEIKLSLETIINKNTNMEKIKLSTEASKALGVSVEPDLTELNAAVMELSAKLTLATEAQKNAEKELGDHKTKQAVDLVDLAIKEGRITADKKESFIKLATTDFKQAKELLDSIPGKKVYSEKMSSGDKTPAGREDWNYMRWLKEDGAGLKAMEVNEPEKFATLKANYKKA